MNKSSNSAVSVQREGPIDFAIVTALKIEREAVLRHLDSYEKVIEDSELLPYYVGQVKIAGSEAHFSVVVISLLEMGNDEAAVATTQLISRWQPASVIMVGIAGGVAGKVSLGDVVVANFSHYYELAKLTEEGVEARPQQFYSDRMLYSRADAYDAGEWRSSVSAVRPGGVKQKELLPDVKFGPIASGDKVIASQDELNKLIAQCPKLLAVAMEGAGVARAARNQVNTLRFLEIRGICDLANKKKNDKWHEYAADTAAAFTIGFLRGGHLPPPIAATQPASIKQEQPLLVIRAQSFSPIATTAVLSALEADPELKDREIDTVSVDFTDLTDKDNLSDPSAAVSRLIDPEGPLLGAMVRRSKADLVFHGLAHIPLVVLAGHLITDRQPVRLFDFHTDTWAWPEQHYTFPPLEVRGLPTKTIRKTGDAIIRVSISYAAEAAQTKVAVPHACAEVDLMVPRPERGIVRSEEQVHSYGQEFRRVIDTLARYLPAGRRIHLFYAGPMALAFHIGQQISANIHPPITVWNYRQGYGWAIDLAAAFSGESCIVRPPVLT